MLALSRNNILEDIQMGNQIVSGSISVALSQLWADKGVQKCYKRRNEFQLEDCAKHVLDNVERIWSRDYKPTNQDILYSRVRTTGVQEIQFQAKLRPFHVYDAGGQRSERRKWIHLFDMVDSVIFIAALSDYNIVMHEEDKEKNSLIEALELFEAVLGIEWFADKAMILFLNKKDLFEEKLELFPLKELFPEFEGGANYDHGLSFLTKEFNQRNKSEMRQIYTHTTCATDSDQVEKVIDSVINLIIGLNAQKSGFEIQKFKQRKSPSLYKFPTASTSSSALTSSLSSPCFLEPDAGSEILEHYRMCWSETHRLTEENIKAAQQCSEQLNRRQQQFRHQAISYLHLHKQATGLPSLAEQLSDLVAETANLQGLCEEVESSLAYLEVICDTQEFQEKKLDAKFNLALYREQKMAEMNERKACMTMNFLSRIESKAKDKALEQVEKQRLYQHAFEQDLNLYKATGLIANTLPPLGEKEPLLPRRRPLHPRREHDVTLLTDVMESRQIRGAKGILAEVLREKVRKSEEENCVEIRKSDLETDWTEAPVDERALENLEVFLSDVKLEDSGIAGSDCQSVNGETDQDSPTEATPCDQYEKL